jgi:isopenicillin-N N-acyltransferase-like protein
MLVLVMVGYVPSTEFPRVPVQGGPRERGRQYGEQARERVRLSVAAYEEVFAHYAGWDWPRVRAEAEPFQKAIASFNPRYLEEIRGIAEGAALDHLDVVAINVRTEVMFAARARDAAAQSRPAAAECSAFALLPQASGDGSTYVGQNWDWLLHCFDTVVVLEAKQDEGPDYVTVVEAGLLAKTGMNSSGIALVTNALVTAEDKGIPGVPYHLALRAILDSENVSDALTWLQRGIRASSANYLIAHDDGVCLDVEAAPGDFSRLFLAFPSGGVLLHTNHFISPNLGVKDVSVWAMPDSPIRLQRLRDALDWADGRPPHERLQQVLSDHANHPSGICCHPDPRLAQLDQGATVASVIMQLPQRRMWLAAGQPCRHPYQEIDYSEFLGKASALRSELLPA